MKLSNQTITPQFIQTTIDQLSEAQQKWCKLTLPERQKVLRVTATRLIERKTEVATLITNEMGKPIRESTAEVEKCLKTIQLCCTENHPQLASRELSTAYSKSVVTHQPLGVIYGIMPWNFPLWQAVRMIYPALLSGNTVLLKHAEITQKVGELIAELFDGLWSEPLLKHALIEHELTEQVISNPKIGGVSLTGSTGAGKIVAGLAGKYLKKSVLELGGSDPYIVFSDADLAKAARVITAARLMNTGQSCICAKRCLVEQSVLDQFLDMLKNEFDKAVFGDPLEAQTTLGPLAHPRFVMALQQQLHELEEKTKAQLVYQKKHNQDPKKYTDSRIYLLKENSRWLYDQEFFSPVLIVIPFQSTEEAIEIANSTEYALGASVWSTDLHKAQSVATAIVAGQIAINDQVKSDYSLPFGGFKNSGLGRELGLEGFLEFTETKVISVTT